ncbi:MAG: hypothetical protein AABZ31_09295, partial [Bdellovibrionota bacterium]
MPINTYVDPKSGETLFRIRISRSSSTISGVIVDKRAAGFKTKLEAERAEKKLIGQVERELLDAESRSCRWDSLVTEWELAARSGDIFIREISVGTIRDYTDVIYGWTQDWMKLRVTEIDRAKAWTTLDRVEREISIARRKRLRTAIDAIFKWGILSGRIKGMSVIPTEGYKSTRKEEEKMPEILNLGQ